ncbi:hypothetical protein M9Y10_027932 [Tritrichomonas musculus]|uniref:DUF3447 domain-containing protein n=1 Tax=Tritrichomonas musculus TaxID=1915356 RepID=A0ABR2H4L0_9EUKA
MDVSECINQIYDLQQNFLEYIDNIEEDSFDSFINYTETQKIRENADKLRIFLSMISIVSNNHHRTPHFIEKIEKILQYFESSIKQSFTNSELFNIFKNNKRILLYLFQKQIITIDKDIYYIIKAKQDKALTKYRHYFINEIEQIIEREQEYIGNLYCYFSIEHIIKEINKICPNISIKSELFESLKKNGENDSYLCSLIRQDSIKEFVSYVNKTNLPIKKATIEPSFFETNHFLNKKETVTLIEYATFFGSIQVFQFLKLSGVELTPSLWLFAIHSNCPEMIHLLEEFDVKPDDMSYEKCLKESIKCHHNEIANYIYENLLANKEINHNITKYCFNYHNFVFQHLFIDPFIFIYSLQFDYLDLVKLCIKEKGIDDINMTIILKFVLIKFPKKK